MIRSFRRRSKSHTGIAKADLAMNIARRKNMLHDGMVLHAREFSRVLKDPLRRARPAARATIVQYELSVFAMIQERKKKKVNKKKSSRREKENVPGAEKYLVLVRMARKSSNAILRSLTFIPQNASADAYVVVPVLPDERRRTARSRRRHVIL